MIFRFLISVALFLAVTVVPTLVCVHPTSYDSADVVSVAITRDGKGLVSPAPVRIPRAVFSKPARAFH
ncbi:MAG: hypothetical protein HYY16_06600 [Planctomycetes bacterium]|nr:hypothetical protein [Planctomycetota bacterium]